MESFFTTAPESSRRLEGQLRTKAGVKERKKNCVWVVEEGRWMLSNEREVAPADIPALEQPIPTAEASSI